MDGNKNKLITVFTPTFNRATIIPKLYNSLVNQSFRDFEWIVVDDGSTDNTEAIFKNWVKESVFPIRYIKVQNGGKHRAINLGVNIAQGELFFIVDSDDVLLPDSLELIASKYSEIKDDSQFCGLAGSLGTPQGHRIGGYFPDYNIDCSCIDFRLKYKIKGDMAEVFKTDIMKQFPFPEFDGEKFCPEALVWNRIGLQYKMRFMPDITYVTEYLPDGLTAKITELRHHSPKASCLYYSEFTRLPIPIQQKIKGAVNYWRFNDGNASGKISLLLNAIGFVPGKLMRLRDKT